MVNKMKIRVDLGKLPFATWDMTNKTEAEEFVGWLNEHEKKQDRPPNFTFEVLSEHEHECKDMRTEESDAQLFNAKIDLPILNNPTLIFRGGCSIHIIYCPWCGAKTRK